MFGIIRPLPGLPPAMELYGTPYQASLEPGTEVVTSGVGGVFPRGIPIGRVQELVGTEAGWA
ncbi:MAG: rod shape-determining protein MreC, partial [Gammaproteobacteria bacterium]|nr:rod shape-determining protein MreC [Gammaproteobacteria bacterium]NIX86342.1 rod shape-determining protein MreC [Gammaproteobacteria bacterium]